MGHMGLAHGMWLSQDVDILWTGPQIHEDPKENQLKSAHPACRVRACQILCLLCRFVCGAPCFHESPPPERIGGDRVTW